MEDDQGDRLRDMAAHRGFRLVKSRRRKPGAGDYGLFGLTDLDGKALLGMGDVGLTATAKDVETYLRKGSTDTWQASADATPARPKAAARQQKEAGTEQEEAKLAIRSRANRKSVSTGKSVPPEGRTARGTEARAKKPAASRARKSGRHPYQKVGKAAELPKELTPKPELFIRVPHASDAGQLAPLLSQLALGDIDEITVAGNLELVRKAKGGMAVAEYGRLIGFCSWAVIPTVQHGQIGRITLLLVDQGHRRRGIATALVAAAETALRKAGCIIVEVTSDIAIANAHGFFRSLKFEQTSYRFAREITPLE